MNTEIIKPIYSRAQITTIILISKWKTSEPLNNVLAL